MLILGIIKESALGLVLWLLSGIYSVAAYFFQLFLILANGRVLDEGVYETMISNFYVILGIIMLFFLAFTLLQGIVNPDDSNKGTSTVKKVVINLVTSSILMAVLPAIFSFAFDFQSSILTNNVIGKFFGYGSAEYVSDSCNDLCVNEPDDDQKKKCQQVCEVRVSSYQMVNGIYTAFLNINPDMPDQSALSASVTVDGSASVTVDGNSETCDLNNMNYEMLQICQASIVSDGEKKFSNQSSSSKHTLYDTINYVDTTGKFSAYTAFANNIDDDELDFYWFISFLASLALIYVSVSFCFDMALRLVKLVFYQLVAPIPIFARVIPEGKASGLFGQWIKITLTCYAEVFVRNAEFLTTEVYKYGLLLGLLANAFVLMGIVMFMKQAPKLISDITGIDSGNMKLGIKDKLKDATSPFTTVADRATRLGFGLAGLAGQDEFGKNPLAAIRAFRQNYQNRNLSGTEAEIQRKRAYDAARANGATRGQIMTDYLRKKFGMASQQTVEDRRIEDIEYINDHNGNRLRYGTVNILDENGNVIDTRFGVVDSNGDLVKDMGAYNAGSHRQLLGTDVRFNTAFKNMLETETQENEKIIKDREEAIRRIQEINSHNQSSKSHVDSMESRAESKLREGKGNITDTITTRNGTRISGGLRALESQVEELLKDQSLDTQTRNELISGLKEAKDRMVHAYMDKAQNDSTFDNVLSPEANQLLDDIRNGVIRGLNGEVLAAKGITLTAAGIQGHSYSEIVEAFKEAVGSVNGAASVEINNITREKSDYERRNKDNAEVTRLHESTQAEEKRSNSYRAISASSTYTSDNSSITGSNGKSK